MSELETKQINAITPVSPNNSRRILCGDGVLTVESLKQFLLQDLTLRLQSLSASVSAAASDIDGLKQSDVSLQAAVSSITASLSGLSTSVQNITTGGLLFNAVGFQVFDSDKKPIPEEYGYLIMKKTSAGKLTLSAVTKSEYEQSSDE